jgi:saccharopine dehydrogenase-like NADP-dependent oxidoreductase
MKIVVLGGAGKMGCIAVQALAGDQRVEEVVIADYNLKNAQIVAEYLKNPKVIIQRVDVNDSSGLVAALEGAQACLNATVYYTNLQIMEACLEAGVSYTDMGGLFHTTLKQLKLSRQYEEKGISAVLGMGSAPGIPNVQARYAAERLDTIDYIRIYDGIKPPDPDDVRFTYAVSTILDELTLEPMVFEDGEFLAKQPLTGFEDYWFSPPLGLLSMHYSLHSEVATLPITFKNKGINECFFKINYWGMAKETVEKVNVLAEFGFAGREAVDVAGTKITPREFMVAMMENYVPPVTDFLAAPKNQPPDWVKEIVTEVKGTKDGQEVIFRLGTLTVKGALPTGVAPAITAIWLAEQRVPPGVHPPEVALEAEPFFKELDTFGIPTKVTITQNL